MGYCPKCNAEIRDTDKFCSSCGHTISKPNVEHKPFYKKKAVIISVIAVVILIVAGVAISFLYGSEGNRFNKAMNDGNYKDASSILDSADGEEYEEYVAQLHDLLNKTVDEYNAEKIDYESAKSILKDISDNFGQEFITQYNSHLEELHMSKEAFSDAQQSQNSGKPHDAILLYRKVTEADTNYDEAQTQIETCMGKYKTEILAEAQKYESAENYEAAISLLQEANSFIGGDSDIVAQINLYKDAVLIQQAAEIVAEAEEAIENGDYPKAISILNNATMTHSLITKKLAECKDTYKNDTLKQAEQYANDSDYESAVSMLNAVTTVLGNDTDILNKIEEYKAKFPVKLTGRTISSGKNYFSDTLKKDIYGNLFEEGLLFSNSGWNSDIEKQTEYVLNKLYKRLTGSVMIASNSSDDYRAYIRIYADDVLIFDSKTMSKKSKPIKIDIDVTGVTFLKIEEKKVSTPSYGDVLISEPMLKH